MAKTVLITGGNRGIGLETARQLAGKGFQAFIGTRDPAAGQKAAAGLKKAGAEVTALPLDAADSASIKSAADALARQVEQLDVLINNAGIYPDEGYNILNIAREQLVTTFQTNTFGPLAVVQAFLPLLRKAKHARIINLSSGLGQLDGMSSGIPSYSLSKLAVNGVTILLASALKSDGIAVNSMCPGWVRTDMGGASAPRSVEQGADTAVWLASEASAELTGKFFRDRKEIPW
ncbi:MAG TPA: SDR family NAD(P)-dependent oxidoreductase [Candidatus Saccharimonadales bacterium]|nr:SDR family NAD(P)-dependent oxidoreductase [Candidatus Saccharimonadales bacterium]